MLKKFSLLLNCHLIMTEKRSNLKRCRAHLFQEIAEFKNLLCSSKRKRAMLSFLFGMIMI